MLPGVALGVVNHLLFHENWARARLKPFCGQTVRLEAGMLVLSMRITKVGLFELIAGDTAPSVTVSLPVEWLRPSRPSRLTLADQTSIFSLARISGSVDLAEVLGFVFRNLRWDAESDLSILIGDVAAHRLVQSSNEFVRWHQKTAKRLALNLAEFFIEEDLVIARKSDLAKFFSAVGSVRDDCEWLEKRLQVLEKA